MPWHHNILGLVKINPPGPGLGPAVGLVEKAAAIKIPGVRIIAFPTLGAADGVVFINASSGKKAQEAVAQVQRIFKWTEVFVGATAILTHEELGLGDEGHVHASHP